MTCPFHHDKTPSGSIHSSSSRSGSASWLFTCHGCPHESEAWNQAKPQKPSNSGDAIAILRAAHRLAGHDLSFADAVSTLEGLAASAALPTQTMTTCTATPQMRRTAEVAAGQALNELMTDPESLTRLFKERAIDYHTASRFGIGLERSAWGDRWSLPIFDDSGQFVARKLHACAGGQPKALWDPEGANGADLLFPINVRSKDVVFLAPGELKAASIASLDLNVIGITSGEKRSGLSKNALNNVVARVGSREVAIVPDNDETGREWADATARQLVGAGISVRIIDLSLIRTGEDVGDWIGRASCRERV